MVKDDGKQEDMCSDCRGISYSAEFLDVHEYQHQHLTELLDLYNYIADSHKEN